jgi:hypothetical protein
VTHAPEHEQTGRPETGARELSIERVEELPKEVGVLLVALGLLGLVLPGPIGTPALVAGGVVLWPAAFRGVARSLERRFPRFHRTSFRQLARFLDDLERRYPSTTPPHG